MVWSGHHSKVKTAGWWSQQDEGGEEEEAGRWWEGLDWDLHLQSRTKRGRGLWPVIEPITSDLSPRSPYWRNFQPIFYQLLCLWPLKVYKYSDNWPVFPFSYVTINIVILSYWIPWFRVKNVNISACGRFAWAFNVSFGEIFSRKWIVFRINF